QLQLRNSPHLTLFLQPFRVSRYSPIVGQRRTPRPDASPEQPHVAVGCRTLRSTALPRANRMTGVHIMFKWTALVWTGLACCLALPVLAGNLARDESREWACLPPPITQDYLKKTVRVELMGKLSHIQNWHEGERDPRYPMPNIIFIDFWQIEADGMNYRLDLSG